MPYRALSSPAAVKMPAVVASSTRPPWRTHIPRINSAVPPRMAYMSLAVTGQTRGIGTRRALREGVATCAVLRVS